MSVLQHVNGPARLYVNTQAATTFSAAHYLGLSNARGVRLRFQRNSVDVETDASGPTPADTQVFPEMAFISFLLVAWDEAVLQSLLSTKIGAGTWLEGQTVPPGALLGASGGFKALRIDSPYERKPYVFNYCQLFQDREVNLGTERSGYQITLRAQPGIGTNSDPGGYESASNLTKLYYRPSS